MSQQKELHFFPGPHVLLWFVDGVVRLRAEAWGGVDPDPSAKDDVMEPRKTTPGRYIVHSLGPYQREWGRWAWSRIRWGARLRLETKGRKVRVMYETGERTRPWRPVSSVLRGITFEEIRDRFSDIYGVGSRYDWDRDGFPDTWVFNDFGPLAVRYFRDRNHNRRLDKDQGERLMGEMIHTTPENEGEEEQGRSARLYSSHGCIHVAPSSRDAFAAAGAFGRGTTLLVHSYDESVPARLQ